MTPQTRAYAYLRQGPSLAMTPRQQRRFKRKLRKEQDRIIAAAVYRGYDRDEGIDWDGGIAP